MAQNDRLPARKAAHQVLLDHPKEAAKARKELDYFQVQQGVFMTRTEKELLTAFAVLRTEQEYR